MNFYVYDYSEMQIAMQSAKHVGNPKVEEHSNYISLDWGNSLQIIYPSASLWNKSVSEVLSFPHVDAVNANYFLVPLSVFYGGPDSSKKDLELLDQALTKLTSKLKYWNKHKGRHVFFVAGDSYGPSVVLKDSSIFRTSCHKGSKDYPLYFDVILERGEIPSIEYCENTCAFVGCLDTHLIRQHLPLMIGSTGKFVLEPTPNFFFKLSDRVRKEMENRWRQVLLSSKFILSPRGCGLNSIRFFEALAFGRIPVLIADNTKLPLEDKIDYDEFIVRVPERSIYQTANYINYFLGKRDLKEASAKAMKIWETYFSGGSLKRFLEAGLPELRTLCT